MKSLLLLALVSQFLCQEALHVSYDIRSVEGTGDGVCPSTQELREIIHQDVDSLINDTILPELQAVQQRPCGCGGPGWRRVAYLNMSDTTQTCPGNWSLITTQKRSCARPSDAGDNTCYSAVFNIQDNYSHVCGRIIGYQFASTDGFALANRHQTINGSYVDGVSLTYGNPRQHIWTFVAALSEFHDHSCPCTNINQNFDTPIPPFVGDDYFCETGVPTGQRWSYTFYADDPLWDGQGCGPTSTCCTFNNPPWFCKQLPQSTNDDLEIRLCCDSRATDENIPIELVEIYIH